MGYYLKINIEKTNDIFNKFMDINEQIQSDDFVTLHNRIDNYYDIDPNTNKTYSEMMFDNVKSQIKSGNPVLVSIRNKNEDTGHTVIAYDYDEEKDIIYGHYGMHGEIYYGMHHANIFGYGYDYIGGYLVIGYKHGHTHCDNYILDGTKICSCKLPNHIHKFTYKSKGSLLHTIKCACGYTATEKHNFVPLISDSSYVVCRECSYKKYNEGGIIIEG